MAVLFINIIQMSISASITILIVFFFRFLLRKMPKFFLCFLWTAVLIKLLVPFSFKGIYHFIPLKLSQQSVYLEETHKEINYFAKNNFSVLIQGHKEDTAEIYDNVSIAAEENNHYIFNALTYLWLAGFCTMILYNLKSYTYIFKLKKNSQRHEGYSNVYCTENLITPFVAGIFKPIIFVPSGLGEREKQLIICHEQIHIKRMDYLFKLVFYAALSIHWFNPLVWIAFSAMERDMEMACDEAVIKVLGTENKKDYAMSLLRFTLCRNEKTVGILGFGRNHIEGRINNVLNYKKKSFSYLLIGFIMMLFAACTAISEPGDKEEALSETAIINSEGEYTITLTTEMPEGNKPAYFDILVRDENNLDEILELDGSTWTYKQNFIDGEPVINYLTIFSDNGSTPAYNILVDSHFPELQDSKITETESIDKYTENSDHTYVVTNDGYRLTTTIESYDQFSPYRIVNLSFIYGDEENYDIPFVTNENGETLVRFYAVKENQPVYFSRTYISNDGQYLYLNDGMGANSKGFKRN